MDKDPTGEVASTGPLYKKSRTIAPDVVSTKNVAVAEETESAVFVTPTDAKSGCTVVLYLGVTSTYPSFCVVPSKI